MKAQKGFSLVELMVVVAIIGILASVALPAYQDYVTRSKIPDATSALAAKRVNMEQYYQDNRTYVGGPGCTADTTTSKYFTFDCLAAGALPGVPPTTLVYTIHATGINSMAGFNYTINETNTMASTIVAPAPTNWRATQAACWITKTGGVC